MEAGFGRLLGDASSRAARPARARSGLPRAAGARSPVLLRAVSPRSWISATVSNSCGIVACGLGGQVFGSRLRDRRARRTLRARRAAARCRGVETRRLAQRLEGCRPRGPQRRATQPGLGTAPAWRRTREPARNRRRRCTRPAGAARISSSSALRPAASRSASIASAGRPFSSSSPAIPCRSRDGTSHVAHARRGRSPTSAGRRRSAGSSDPRRIRACAAPRLSPRPCRRSMSAFRYARASTSRPWLAAISPACRSACS